MKMHCKKKIFNYLNLFSWQDGAHPESDTSLVSPRSAGTSPDSDPEGVKKTSFHRSISEIVSDDDSNQHEKNLGRLFSGRRRNNSGGVGGRLLG